MFATSSGALQSVKFGYQSIVNVLWVLSIPIRLKERSTCETVRNCSSWKNGHTSASGFGSLKLISDSKRVWASTNAKAKQTAVLMADRIQNPYLTNFLCATESRVLDAHWDSCATLTEFFIFDRNKTPKHWRLLQERIELQQHRTIRLKYLFHRL